MPKRLVIGIGGTGLDVIRNLRRRIVEANPEKGLGPRLSKLAFGEKKGRSW